MTFLPNGSQEGDHFHSYRYHETAAVQDSFSINLLLITFSHKYFTHIKYTLLDNFQVVSIHAAELQ